MRGWLAGRLTDIGLASRWSYVSLVTLVYWLIPQSVRLFYPLRLEDLGAPDFVIGLGVASSAVAGMLLAIPSGYLLDRFNSQRVLIITTLGLSLTTGAFALATSVGAMIALMFVQGMFQMWVWLVLQEMITRVGEGTAANRQLSLFSLAWGIGLAAGPSLSAWLYDRWDFETLCVVFCLLCLVGTVGALLVPTQLRFIDNRDGSSSADHNAGIVRALRRSFRDVVVVGVMASTFINVFVQTLRLSFYPVFLERQGVAIATIGMLLSVIGISSLGIRFVLPALIRQFGLVRPLMWSTWCTLIGVAITPMSDNVVVLACAALLIGCGMGANPPITVQLLAGDDGGDRGLAVGLRMVANRSAQVVQPLVFAGLAAVVGLGPAFPVAAALLGVATVWMGRRLASIDRGTASDQGR